MSSSSLATFENANSEVENVIDHWQAHRASPNDKHYDRIAQAWISSDPVAQRMIKNGTVKQLSEQFNNAGLSITRRDLPSHVRTVFTKCLTDFLEKHREPTPPPTHPRHGGGSRGSIF